MTALRRSLPKCPTGIKGLDEITGGGLPSGRTTLVCGAAGCGKTLLGLEFLIRGIADFGEPGVCVTFEETAEDIVTNGATMGFDLAQFMSAGKLAIDHVFIERSQIEETGEYDLEGLFVRLGHAIDSVGAKRVVLDTIEALFAGLSDDAMLRAELRRLLRWLKQKGVTSILTGERADGRLTRHGLEEYVSDCVILLDHKAEQSISTRRLRIVKYRGSQHGTNDYPFLIDDQGLSVLPITSIQLAYPAPRERVSTGVEALDSMLGGNGYFRGSTVLISGSAGTGKTTFASFFCDRFCRAGGRALFFTFEESPDQIERNMSSVGLDLKQWREKGLLCIDATRPTMTGLESHLVRIHRIVVQFDPGAVVLDPLSSFVDTAQPFEVASMIARLTDYLKQRGIVTVMTHQIAAGTPAEGTASNISSLVDTWVLLRDSESEGERNRGFYVLKSRGMRHSNQVQEFVFTDQGINVPTRAQGSSGGLVGAVRLAQEQVERRANEARRLTIERKEREIARKRRMIERQMAELRADLEEDEVALRQLHAGESIASLSESEETFRLASADPNGTGVAE